MNKDMASIRDEWRELRSRIGNLICAVDGKVESCEVLNKKMQEKKDESYLKGAEDMLEANRILTDLRKNGGMSCNDMACIFGSANSSYIILHKSAEEILNGVNQWKKEKQEEFKPGDEIVIVDPSIRSNGEKRIVTNVGTNSIHLIEPATFNVTWIEKEHAKKTGKHYDAVPFSKDDDEGEEE